MSSSRSARGAVVFARDEVAEWLERSKRSVIPVNQRRERLRSIARQELLRRTGRDEDWPQAGPLRAALNAAWPTQQPVRLVDRILADLFAGPKRQAAGLDDRRPVARRRGQLDPQRPAARVRPRRRRRGAGPLGGRAARDRAAQPGDVDDARRRRRPVDDAGRPGTVGGRARPASRRSARRTTPVSVRRAHDRLPRSRADPRAGEPAAPVHRRRRDRQPERASRGRAAVVGRDDLRRARRSGRRRRHDASSTGTA